ncbi:MAG: NADH-quinone oxidoreductase subunit J family protein [Thermoplasmata archaeon]
MNLEDVAFLLLAGAAVGTALLALLVRELVHTILWVAGFFVVLAALYFLAEATFLGVLQLGVYAGAVTVLLLFGVMVTRRSIFRREAATGIGATSVALAALVLLLVGAVAWGFGAARTPGVSAVDPTLLSVALFSTYGAWLLLVGLAMLSALAGAIYLVREGRE